MATVVLTTTLPRGTSNNVTVTDNLTVAAGLLGFDPASVSVTLGGVVLAPGRYTVTAIDSDGDGIADRVVFAFGAVTIPGNADPATVPLVISYRATALDTPANQGGGKLDLPATLDYSTASGNAAPLTAVAGVDLVTPVLTLAKAVVKTTADIGSLNGITPPGGALAGTAGDVFTYTLTIGHAGGSTAPAYDLNLIDTLGAGLVLVTGSATTTFGGGSVTETATGLAINGPQLLLGQSFTVVYRARIADSVVYGSVLPNSAQLGHDTLAGPGGRAAVTSAAALVVLQGDATVVKTVIATGNPLTGSDQFNPAFPDVTVGETITWRITANANAFVDVVEPRLVIDKSVAESSRVPGQIATYTLILRHAPGSAAAAADITVRDLLTADLTLVPGSLVIVSAPAGFTPSVSGTSVSLSALPLGAELVYRFGAVIGFGVDATRPLVNTATASFASTPRPWWTGGPGHRHCGLARRGTRHAAPRRSAARSPRRSPCRHSAAHRPDLFGRRPAGIARHLDRHRCARRTLGHRPCDRR